MRTGIVKRAGIVRSALPKINFHRKCVVGPQRFGVIMNQSGNIVRNERGLAMVWGGGVVADQRGKLLEQYKTSINRLFNTRFQIKNELANAADEKNAAKTNLDSKKLKKLKHTLIGLAASLLPTPFIYGYAGALVSLALSLSAPAAAIAGIATSILGGALTYLGISSLIYRWTAKRKAKSEYHEKYSAYDEKENTLVSNNQDILKKYEDLIQREALASEIRSLMASKQTEEFGREILNIFGSIARTDLASIMHAQTLVEKLREGEELDLKDIKDRRADLNNDLQVAGELDQIIARLEDAAIEDVDIDLSPEPVELLSQKIQGATDLKELRRVLEWAYDNWDLDTFEDPDEARAEVAKVVALLETEKEGLEQHLEKDTDGSDAKLSLDIIFNLLTKIEQAKSEGGEA